jgi:DNA-binding FadR family transcriptional regulator
VAEQIAALIDEGEFPPGSKLPAERELAERFGVSRVTIREAAISLQSIGRVTIRAGSGVYVSRAQDGGGNGLPVVGAFEVTEARCLFESEAAALAAPIISDEDLARLDELLLAMAGAGEDADRADREFHGIIASASGNRAIIHVINELWRMRTEVPDVIGVYAAVCLHDPKSRVEEHGAVLEALKRRDAAGARNAMRLHFTRLLQAMLDAAEQRELEEVRRRSEESRARYQLAIQTA